MMPPSANCFQKCKVFTNSSICIPKLNLGVFEKYLNCHITNDETNGGEKNNIMLSCLINEVKMLGILYHLKK